MISKYFNILQYFEFTMYNENLDINRFFILKLLTLLKFNFEMEINV